MLSLFNLRVPSALSRNIFRVARAPATRQVLSNVQARSFLTTAIRFDPAKAATEKKPTEKKTAVKKPAVKKKPAAKKKPAKKPVAKKTKPKKVVIKNPAKYVVPADMKPPTRPPTAFAQFISELSKTRPYTNVTELTKAGSVQWKALSQEERDQYSSKFSAELETYHKVRAEWARTVDRSVLNAMNRRRVLTGKLRIHRRAAPEDKQPPTPFFAFAREFRASWIAEHGPTTTMDTSREVSRHAGIAWRALTVEEREMYTKRFIEQLAEWKVNQKIKNEVASS